jgi:acyl-CoA synthetase (AMP-forming)/AMP-acid ligase II
VLLLGSAPVGPSTTKWLLKYANKLPTVRFGSTETTLQVCGIPLSLRKDEVMKLFEAGWNNSFDGAPCAGYYIGREHAPYTSVRIVQSVSKDSSSYLKDCVGGQPGYIITRGNNLMTGYVGQQKVSTSVVSDDGWYLNLGDIGFWLGESERRDIYWQSRESHILIRGGANYAFEQVSAELKAAVCKKYQISENSVLLAVCGIRDKSEHEDECCVILELLDESAKKKQIDIEMTFLEHFRQPGVVSKGSKPDKFIVGKIPMVATKHVVDVAAMVKLFWKSKQGDS